MHTLFDLLVYVIHIIVIVRFLRKQKNMVFLGKMEVKERERI